MNSGRFPRTPTLSLPLVEMLADRIDGVDDDAGGLVAPCRAGERPESGEERLLAELKLLWGIEMERVEGRDEGRVWVDPDEITHSAFGNEPGDLVGGVSVGIDKKAAAALTDVLDEEIDEQGGLAHARHAFD